MTKWNPSPEDVKKLCEAVTESYISEDNNTGGDYCSMCGYYWGNVNKYKGPLPHKTDCPVLIAQDVMTGIPNAIVSGLPRKGESE